MDKVKLLGLYEAIRSDYKDLIEKELDTDGEIEKRGRLIGNIKAMYEHLVSAPVDLQDGIRDVLATLDKWDVYAYWFKEEKELVSGVQGLLDRCKGFLESSGLLEPPATKPVAPPQPVRPASPAPAPARPVPPSAPERPTPPASPVLPHDGTTAGLPGHGEVPSRVVPVLKPVFKILPRIQHSPDKGSIQPQAGEVTGTPVSLRSVLEGGKMEIHVKPVRLIKPIVASDQAVPPKGLAGGVPGPVPVTTPPVAVPASGPRPVAVPFNPLAMSPGKVREDPEPRAVKPALLVAKPFRIPKPVKIAVPALEGIDIAMEIPSKPAPVIIQDTPEESPPDGARLGRIPVRINMAQPARDMGPASDKNVIDEIAGEVMSRIARDSTTHSVDVVPRPATGPVRLMLPPRHVPVNEPTSVTPDKIDVITRILDSDGDWDEDAIGAVLDGDPGSHQQNAGPAPVEAPPTPMTRETTTATGDGSKASFFPEGFLRTKPEQATGERGGSQADLLSVFTPREPFVSRKDAGKKDAKGSKDEGGGPVKSSPPVQETPVTPSADLFASALASRTRGLAPAQYRPPLFGDPATRGKPAPVVPIGSEVDIDSLPDTKDGLYQSLIALEGKRYSLERARKDLRVDLDRGVIKETAYQQRIDELKAELDGIAARIKDIRTKIKDA